MRSGLESEINQHSAGPDTEGVIRTSRESVEGALALQMLTFGKVELAKIIANFANTIEPQFSALEKDQAFVLSQS